MGNELTEYLESISVEVSPMSFYRGIFPRGELDKEGAFTPGKYTGIVQQITGIKNGKGRGLVKRFSLTDDLKAIEEATKTDYFCICSPLSYAGKRRTAEGARMLYAVAIDLDKIRMEHNRRAGFPTGIIDLFHQFETGYLPRPTYIVSSGTGLHLYYVLNRPVPLFKNYAFEMQELKRALTQKIWNDYVVKINDNREIQQEGIYQGFRMPGTVTKTGERAKAFLIGERVTVEYLNSFVKDYAKAKKTEKYKYGKITLAEAEKLYPNWYERRIVKGQKRGQWAVNRALYDWWKKKIIEEAREGHRYYCIMILAIYAQKCGVFDAEKNPHPVTREELEEDCFSLLEPMEKLSSSEDNHFTEDDIQAALEAYDNKWITYPREVIEYKSGIDITPSVPRREKGKRLKQKEHLEEARTIRDIRSQRSGAAWDDNNGRKSKYNIVKEWKEAHPGGGVKECILDTGLSQATVYRHWKEEGQKERIKKITQKTKKDKAELEETAEKLRNIINQAKELENDYTLTEAEKETLEAAAELLKGLEPRKTDTEGQ